MEKSKKDSSKNLEQKVKEHQEVLLKYPKNIRQIGEIKDGQRIYVEDYVMTYALHLATKAGDAYSSAVLLGQKAIVEGRRTLFISGAVEISQKWQQNLSITSEQWTSIYDQMQKYFHNIEIVGWFLTHPGLDLQPKEQIRSLWRASFEGTDKVLFLYDSISREDAFYTCKDGEFLKQSGYYIYYEKNEEMQNYMIDEKGGESSDAGYKDMTSKKIRQKIHQKNEEQKKYIFHQQLAYSVGIFASAVVLVTAATKLHHGIKDDNADFTQDSQEVFENDSWILSKDITETNKEEEEQNLKEQEKLEEKNNLEEQKESEEKTNLEESGEEPSEETNLEEQKEPDEKEDNKEINLEEKDKQESDENSFKEETDTNTVSTGTKNSSKKERKKYQVKKGDTLESISISCYGTNKYVKKIKKMNKIENANKIYIGQELILP